MNKADKLLKIKASKFPKESEESKIEKQFLKLVTTKEFRTYLQQQALQVFGVPKDGKPGLQGKDGKEIQISVKDGYIKVKYNTDKEWVNLIDLSELKGEGIKGDPGKDGEDGKDGLNGKNGKDGKNGINGLDGEDGTDGREIELKTEGQTVYWRYKEEEWKKLYTFPQQRYWGGGGSAAKGVPTGGTAGQVLSKIDGTDYNTEWIDSTGAKETFETVSKNIKSWSNALTYTGDNLTSIEYTDGTDTITKTLAYTGDNLTSITLSGDTPSGIDLIKTLSYTGDNLTGITYS